MLGLFLELVIAAKNMLYGTRPQNEVPDQDEPRKPAVQPQIGAQKRGLILNGNSGFAEIEIAQKLLFQF